MLFKERHVVVLPESLCSIIIHQVAWLYNGKGLLSYNDMLYVISKVF